MTTGSFPSDPTNRRAILVLQQHDIEKCSYEPGGAHLSVDKEAYILQFPVESQGKMPVALQNILDANLARPGSWLIQNPFDLDTYEDALLAPQRYALAKHMNFSTFCMHLGAKEVSVEQLDVRTRTGKKTFDLKGDRAGVEAGLTVESEGLEMLRSEMHLRDEFEGGPPDVAAAEGFLRRKGLWADQSMQTLLEMRRNSGNQLVTRKLALSLSNETKNNLNVAVRLGVPGFLNISGKYDRVFTEMYEYTMTVLVRF